MGTALMDPEVKAPEATINLMSVYSAHRIGLESPVEVIHPQHGKYRDPSAPGKEIVFHNNRAAIPESWWPLLVNHPMRLVQRGLVNREDEFTAITAVQNGPRVVEGAIAATSRRTLTPPHQGWDEATVKQIGEWVASGVVRDIEAAMSYELAKRRRKMVVRALTDALLGETPSADPEPPPAAAVPDGIGGGDL